MSTTGTTADNDGPDIKVEYPQGAAGGFISSVLACCTQGLPWIKDQRINFHTFPYQVESGHLFDKSPNILAIDSPSARYNFWVYYFRKRILWEINYYRYKGMKWVKCPHNDLDIRGDGYWLLNQARFINTYECQQHWCINWTEMLHNPLSAWETIKEFLDSNGKYNFWNQYQWLEALDDYRKTLPNKIVINPHRVHWQIWATGVLQDQGISPSIDIIENFKNKEYKEWLYNYQENIVKYTQARTFDIS